VQKTTEYDNVRFATDVLEEAAATFGEILPADDRPIDLNTLSVRIGAERWAFDSLDEFFAEHRKVHTSSEMILWGKAAQRKVSVSESQRSTVVSIKSPDRASVVKLSAIFERKASESLLPPPPDVPQPSPRVFIGHGRSGQWRDLKDHLHELHGYEVEAYETGARAGHTIRDILQDMITRSSFAVLVMTAEDETADSDMRARQNVVHETGLMQGALGFSRAIVLLEAGTQDYSNLQGIHQIRYSAGNIKETYGEILATLRREFGAAR
jgi:predicted nucleotide-binding protein